MTMTCKINKLEKPGGQLIIFQTLFGRSATFYGHFRADTVTSEWSTRISSSHSSTILWSPGHCNSFRMFNMYSSCISNDKSADKHILLILLLLALDVPVLNTGGVENIPEELRLESSESNRSLETFEKIGLDLLNSLLSSYP